MPTAQKTVEKARLRMRILSLAVNGWWFLAGGGTFGPQHGGQPQYGGKRSGAGQQPSIEMKLYFPPGGTTLGGWVLRSWSGGASILGVMERVPSFRWSGK